MKEGEGLAEQQQEEGGGWLGRGVPPGPSRFPPMERASLERVPGPRTLQRTLASSKSTQGELRPQLPDSLCKTLSKVRRRGSWGQACHPLGSAGHQPRSCCLGIPCDLDPGSWVGQRETTRLLKPREGVADLRWLSLPMAARGLLSSFLQALSETPS